MGKRLGKLGVVSGAVGVGVGVFVHHQSQPIVWMDATDINQNCGGVEVAESVYAVAIGKGSRQDLVGGLLGGVEAVVAGLQQGIEDGVEAIDVRPNPGADRGTAIEIKDDIDHVGIQGMDTRLVEVV
jgi:hypothetical protein